MVRPNHLSTSTIIASAESYLSLQLDFIKHTTGATPKLVRGGRGHEFVCNPPTKRSRVHMHTIRLYGKGEERTPAVAKLNFSWSWLLLKLRKVYWARGPLVSLSITFPGPSRESRESPVFAPHILGLQCPTVLRGRNEASNSIPARQRACPDGTSELSRTYFKLMTSSETSPAISIEDAAHWHEYYHTPFTLMGRA